MIDYIEVNEIRKCIKDNINKISIDDLFDFYKLFLELIKPKKNDKTENIFGYFNEIKNEIKKDIPGIKKEKIKKKFNQIEMIKSNIKQYDYTNIYFEFSERNKIKTKRINDCFDIYICCKNIKSDYYRKNSEWILDYTEVFGNLNYYIDPDLCSDFKGR